MIAAALLLLQVGVATGAAPDTVTVGDPFRVLVRVSAPPGARVEFPPVLARNDTLGALGAAPQVQVSAAGQHTATYRAVAWIPGAPQAPPAAIRVLLPGGAVQAYRVQPPLPFIRSVLPADTTGVRPRGPKDVWGRDSAGSFPWLLLGLAAAALVALVAWWFSKRRQRGALAPPVDPRERALAAITDLVPEDTEAFYVQLSAILREFVAAYSPEWGLDLASRELLNRLSAESTSADQVGTLAALLGAADGVKFARSRPGTMEAEAARDAARDWVQAFGRSEARAA